MREKTLVIIFIIVVSSFYLTMTINSTLDAYVADQAENTIYTSISEMLLLNNGTKKLIQANSLFLFRFTFEVWNSYPTPQVITSPNACGIEPTVSYVFFDPAFTIVDLFNFRSSCNFVETRLKFDVGITLIVQEYYLRFHRPDYESLPMGNYTFSYNKYIEDNPKLNRSFNATIMVLESGIYALYDRLPENYGQVDSSTRVVSLNPLSLFTFVGILIMIRKRYKISNNALDTFK
jgi:hypothetical protein